MSKRTAWLCIGLPHTGGPAVAAAAARHADTLRAHGIRLPAASAEEMRRASAELLREHGDLGYRRRDVEGAWASICRRAWREKGSTLLGDERLAAATEDQVALLLDGLAGLRPRAVVALRDPATLLVEGWAAEVREGRAPTFERYAERVLDPGEEHRQVARSRSTPDLPVLLDRWSSAIGSDRVHLLVLPPGRDPGVALWPELLELIGVPTAGLAAAGVSVAAPPRLPPVVLSQATSLGEKWRARVAESGVHVRGRLDDLVPVPVSGGPRAGRDGRGRASPHRLGAGPRTRLKRRLAHLGA